ncbi:MAG: SipW-dependent-type signal peptide-containing protein [Firmicutes bacterium]|nr:SipW-dependent-type signal peptide-containing protein [Candidatus Colimorpha enterica]
MKNTKRSLIMSILSLMLCASMLIGTTYAWFTDSVTSGTNRIMAGNLDIELYTGDDLTEKVDENTKFFDNFLWEPGAVMYENLKVVNKGTLALKYRLNMLINDENFVEQTQKGLKNYLKIAVVKGKTFTSADSREAVLAEAQAAAPSSIAAFEKLGHLTPTGTANDNDMYSIVIWWPSTDTDNDVNVNNQRTVYPKYRDEDGNPYEILYIELGIKLAATQDTVEDDSFDDQYDAQALVTDGKELAAAIMQGGIVNLGADIDYSAADTEDARIIVSKDTTLNLGKYTITVADMGSADNNWSLFYVTDGATLTINADQDENGNWLGGIDTGTNNANGVYGVTVNECTAVINGGNFFVDTSAVYVIKGDAVINDGRFEARKDGTENYANWLINCYDANYGTDASIVVNGGIFYGFNPMNNKAEGAGTNFLADDRSVSESDTVDGSIYFTVVEKQAAQSERVIAADVLKEEDVTFVITNTGNPQFENKVTVSAGAFEEDVVAAMEYSEDDGMCLTFRSTTRTEIGWGGEEEYVVVVPTESVVVDVYPDWPKPEGFVTSITTNSDNPMDWLSFISKVTINYHWPESKQYNPTVATSFIAEDVKVTIPANSELEGAEAGDTLILSRTRSDYKLGVKVSDTASIETLDIAIVNSATGEKVTATGDSKFHVELQLDTGLTGSHISVFHYENKIDAVYDTSTGILAFDTQSFSPYSMVETTYAKEYNEYIPVDAKYYSQPDVERWNGKVMLIRDNEPTKVGDNAGNTPFPELKDGDVLLCEEYVYYYNAEKEGWSVGAVKNVAVPHVFFQSIHGKPVNDMSCCFRFSLENEECLLTTAPEIPDTMVYMNTAFAKCGKLVKAPSVIPENVTDLNNAFKNCPLTETSSIEINANIDPENTKAWESCFWGNARLQEDQLALTGSSHALEMLKISYNNQVN